MNVTDELLEVVAAPFGPTLAESVQRDMARELMAARAELLLLRNVAAHAGIMLDPPGAAELHEALSKWKRERMAAPPTAPTDATRFEVEQKRVAQHVALTGTPPAAPEPAAGREKHLSRMLDNAEAECAALRAEVARLSSAQAAQGLRKVWLVSPDARWSVTNSASWLRDRPETKGWTFLEVWISEDRLAFVPSTAAGLRGAAVEAPK